MRIINIDLSQDTRCPQKVFGGNAREHNESKLIVKLPERILRDDISYYYFEFQTVLGEHIVSPNIYKSELLDGNKISVLLWEQLLPFAGDLSFCINAVNLAEDNTITIKGKTNICTLQILKSPTGEDALIDVGSTKEDLQKAIDDGVNEVVKKISIVGQKTPNGGEIFSTYEGENANKALGEASSAFGQNNIAGCLGFKVSNFVKGTSTEGAKVTLNTDATHFANIEVGDLVSVKINYNATGLKVTAIDTTNKVVTLDYKLSTFPDFVASDDDYLWLVEKPEAGDTSIGIGAFAGGFKGNQANQDGSLALGRDNIADGRFSVALGTGNKAGYNTFTFGKNNNALHAESTSVFGTSNTIENCYGGLFAGKSNNVLTQSDTFVLGSNNSLAKNGGNNFILGSNNSLAENSNNSVLLGNHLKTLKGYCYYVGQWNKPVTNYTDPERFSVGIGDSEGSRKNGLTIYQSGYGEIYAQGNTDKSIVQKQYVDNSIATQVSSVYKAKGSIVDISALPTPDKDHEGFVYNIENGFTTTDQFVEGAGKTYPAGTNVVIVNTTGTEYKYDVLAGMVDLSNYATKKYVDDAIGNITALFASLVDMTKTTQADEPVNDTEIVNEPTVDEGGLS